MPMTTPPLVLPSGSAGTVGNAWFFRVGLQQAQTARLSESEGLVLPSGPFERTGLSWEMVLLTGLVPWFFQQGCLARAAPQGCLAGGSSNRFWKNGGFENKGGSANPRLEDLQ
jgi:hypothetical protein